MYKSLDAIRPSNFEYFVIITLSVKNRIGVTVYAKFSKDITLNFQAFSLIGFRFNRFAILLGITGDYRC